MQNATNRLDWGKRRLTIMRKLLWLAGILALPLFLLLLARGAMSGANRILERRYPPPGQMVPVGDYKLQLYCSGSGSPTVVIEPGMGVDWVDWRRVTSSLQPTNRVCVYDRAGYGWSDPGPMPRTALLEARELHSLLSRAAIPQPYILAGHSYGGYIARLYASQFRDSLAGVVLVEPDELPPNTAVPPKPSNIDWHFNALVKLIPPLGFQRLHRMYAGDESVHGDLHNAPRVYRERYLISSSPSQLQFERNESDSLPLTVAQIRATVFPRDLPLTVITAMRARAANSIRPGLHARLAQSSQFGRQIFAWGSRHMIPLEEPELIVSAVRDMIQQPHRPDYAAR